MASATKYDIPYGTCVLNSEGELKEISEKPSFNANINAGVYAFNSNIIKFHHNENSTIFPPIKNTIINQENRVKSLKNHSTTNGHVR